MGNQPEVWLRGPLPDIPSVLMPAAHSLLQTEEDVHRAVADLSPDEFWTRPAGAASVGYHVLHLAGSLDRLLTYARGEQLSDRQRRALEEEGSDARPDPAVVLRRFDEAIQAALAQIRATDPATLTDARAVGRANLPSTVLGLTFHAAEHSQRHAGQIATTARILRGTRDGDGGSG
jgi:uncharacterized damage-inducible protein DinB